ncbi:MAG: hypothetical protein AAF743_06445, partial [Planctomycetota bacterium]
ASPSRMVRVPGLGKRTVARLLRMRRWQPVRTEDLQKLRVSLKKVLPWVLVADPNPATRHLDADDLQLRVVKPKQLELFDLQTSALSGEV